MGHIKVTPLRSDEVEAIVAIWNRALRRDPIDKGRFCAWLFGDRDYWPGEDSGLFVARSADERPLGFARAIIRRNHNERLGVEPDKGWLPVFAVDPVAQRQGAGRALLEAALTWFRTHGRREIWVSGGSGSAPGYIFPGVDVDAYPAAVSRLQEVGFAIHHHAVAMAREIVDFELDKFHQEAWSLGGDIVVEPLSATVLNDLLDFFAVEFPGDWLTAARGKITGGRFHELLVARRGGKIVGYCQWEGEHFGPFGVAASERNARVGAKLFVEAVRRIRAADGRNVWFNWADPDAQRFYERYDLKPTRRFAVMHCRL